MDMYGSYKSPFGYEIGINGGVDSYGVDHSGFSTQDELQYQTARAEREKQLAENLQWQGVAENCRSAAIMMKVAFERWPVVL